MKRFLVCLAALSLAASELAAQRRTWSMDPGWRFMLGDQSGAEKPDFDDRSWRTLDLPHDWSIEGALDEKAPGGGRIGYLPAGIGWYRKSFRLPGNARTQKVWIEFEEIIGILEMLQCGTDRHDLQCHP